MRTSAPWLKVPFLAIAIIACVFAPSSPHARGDDDTSDSWTVEKDLWYIMEMGGGKAGWMNSITQRSGDRIRTLSDSFLKFDRVDTPIEIAMTFTFEETVDGKPVRLESRHKMAARPTISTYEFLPDKIVSTSNEGGKEMKKDMPLPSGQWLTPYAADQFAAAQRKAGETEFTYQTLKPDAGMDIVSLTTKRLGEESIEVNGTPTTVTIWNTKIKYGKVQLEATEKYDAEGTMVYQSMAMLGNVITRLSTKEAAMGDAAGPKPELLGSTFITPNKPIENSMKATTATLKLTMKNGEPLSLPTAGAQRAEKGDTPGTVLLKININDNVEASQAEIADKAYTEASPLVDSTDALVMKHAERAVKKAAPPDGENADGGGATAKAEALRAYVHKHINKKGMQTAFASASETINTRAGDCSEHGVLLCAMLRAQGIPARVATGLVYADAFAGHESIFGWHMWTQALIDNRWVDFDATLPPPTRYNAAHVLTATSSLADGLSGTDMASIIPMLGNLDIEVVEVGYEKDEPRANELRP